MNKTPLTAIAGALIRTGRTLTAIALLVGAVPTRAVTVSFDSYTSPSDNDLVNLFNNPGTLTQSASGGITGGSVVASGFADAPIYTTSLNPLGGLATSLFMRYDNVNPPFSDSGFSLRIGFTGSASEGLSVLSSTSYFWGEFDNDTGLIIWSQGSGNGNGFNAVGTTAAPAFGSWLKLTFSESYLGSGQFQLSTMLENYGITGTDTPTLLTSGSVTVANNAAAADTSVYASFSGYYHVSAFDSFSVGVPEPDAFALMALGGLCFALAKIKGREAVTH